jgi:hypothetical protein
LKIKITVKITKPNRYQREKAWGNLYRMEGLPEECFTAFKERKRNEWGITQNIEDEVNMLFVGKFKP